jgi:nucleoid-associated protein YgaU
MTTRNSPGLLRLAAALCAALALVSCNRVQREEFKAERSEKAYRDALADYSAGRLAEARAGFEKAVASDPSNSSARFQLAVLLQDAGVDYLGAMCCYRDYIMLAPNSDKAPLAKARLAECERLYTAQAAQKMNLTDNSEVTAALEKTKDELEKTRKSLGDATAKLSAAESKLTTANREIERMRAVLKRMGEDEEVGTAPHSAATAASSADDAEDSQGPRRIDTAALAADDEEKPLTMNEEAKALFDEEEREEASAKQASAAAAAPDEADSPSGPTLLPQQTEANRAPVRLTEMGRSFRSGDGDAALQRPQTYVVQEGETLSQIALKFYGKKSAWPRIQAANRATISVDGKVRAGQKLVLP